MRAARIAATVLVAALAGGTLTGCSPATEPLLAVGRNPGGQPIVYLQLCGDAQAAHSADIILRGPEPAPAASTAGTRPSTGPNSGSSAGPSAGPSGSWAAGWAVGGPATGGADGDIWRIDNATGVGTFWSIEIGTVPAGWSERPIPTLPAGPVRITPEGHYTVSALTRLPDPTPVDFTLADLDKLKAGEVWGHKGHSWDGTAISLKKFRGQAADAC